MDKISNNTDLAMFISFLIFCVCVIVTISFTRGYRTSKRTTLDDKNTKLQIKNKAAMKMAYDDGWMAGLLGEDPTLPAKYAVYDVRWRRGYRDGEIAREQRRKAKEQQP